MRYRDAAKLHSGDQVTVKETGNTVVVIDAGKWEPITYKRKYILIEVQDPDIGYQILSHLDVT